MNEVANDRRGPDFTPLLDTFEFPEAYRITCLAGAIAVPADDARQARLRITATGRALHERAAAHLRARQDIVLEGLDREEREVFSALPRKAALHAASLDE